MTVEEISSVTAHEIGNKISARLPFEYFFVLFLTHFKWSKLGLNLTFHFPRTLENPSKIKHSTHIGTAT